MPARITDFVENYQETDVIRKRDLIKSPNLKKTFQSINQHLYGKLKYTDTDTRARSKEIVNLLLCKLVDEVDKLDENSLVEFCIRDQESKQELFNRIQDFFKKKSKRKISRYSRKERIH